MIARPDTTIRPSHWIALAAILAAAFFLRYQRLGADAISLDEMWHLELSTGRGSPQLVTPFDVVLRDVTSWTELEGAPPWYKTWTRMERVLHPPLFVLTMRWWREAFGPGDLVAQWFVAAWSMLSIVLTFDIVRRLSRSTAAGLWTAAILAAAPTQILLAQEIRAYTMLMGLSCLAFAVAARIETLGFTRRRAATLAAAMLAMMLTHYFAIALCAAIALWACLRLRGRQLLFAWGGFVAAGLIYAVTWAPIAIEQSREIGPTADPWLKEQSPGASVLAFGRFLAMPLRLLVDRVYEGWIWPALGVLFIVTLLVQLRRRPELLLPILWAAAGCGFLLMLDLVRTTRHLLYIRYSLFAAPALAGLMLMIWMRRPKVVAAEQAPSPQPTWLMHGFGAIVVSLLLWQNPHAYYFDQPDWRLLRKFMVENAKPGEPMLFISGPRVHGYFNEILMLAASREPVLFPRDFVKLSGPATPELIASLRGSTAWLFSGPVENVPEILPGCTVLKEYFITDGEDRSVALCTHVKLPETSPTSQPGARENR